MTIYDMHRKGIEEFCENRPDMTWVPIPGRDGHEQESEMKSFGYKWSAGTEIHEVTDWGNLEKFITSQEISLLQAVIEMALGLLLENEKVEEEYGNRDETAYSSAIADLIVDLEDAIDQIKNDTAV